MTRKDYDALTLEKAKKRKFRLLYSVKTNQMEIPAGTVVSVVAKHDGWTIATQPCRCCGVSVYARKVPHTYLDVVL